MNRYFRICFLSAVSLAFVGLSARYLYKPAIGYEEICEEAVRLMEIGTYGDSHAFAQIALNSKTKLPVFTNNPYNGALDMYLMIPVFYLFGNTLASVRGLMICMSLLTLLFTYFFLKEWFNEFIAAAAVLLLLFQPAFILFGKVLFSNPVLNLFGVIVLYLWARYTRTKNPALVWLMAFICGMGLWRKIVFVWFILAFVMCTAVLYRRELSLKARDAVLVIAAFIFGSFPIWWYNVSSGGATLVSIIRSVIASPNVLGKMDYNNAAFIHNMAERAAQFKGLFGGYSFDWFRPLLEPGIRTYFLPLFLVSLVCAVSYVIFVKDGRFRRKTAFVIGMGSLIFIGLCFSLSSSRALHLYFLIPFPQIVMALFFYFLYHTVLRGTARFAGEKAGKIAAGTATVLLLCGYLTPNYAVIRWINSEDYQTYWEPMSPVMKDIGTHLSNRNINTIVVMDKVVMANVCIRYFSGLKTDLVLFYGHDPESGFFMTLLPPETMKARFREFLEKEKQFYLFTFPDNVYEGEEKVYYETFKKELAKIKHTFEFKDEIRDARGRMIYTISKVVVNGQPSERK